MRGKKIYLIIVLVALALFFGVPAALKAVPPRYLARLPQPLQQLGAPPAGAAILPTVASPLAAQSLLTDSAEMRITAATATATAIAPPATPTPPPVTAKQNSDPSPTPLPSATPLPTATAVPIPASGRLDGFRHQFQTWNNCGPATLAMTLSYFGMNLDQNQTAAFLKPNPEDRNVTPWEMVAFVQQETPYKSLWRANGNMDTLKRLLTANIPVIIEIGIEPPGEYRWLGWYGHYLLVVAYDDELGQFWVYDSWFGTSEVPMENATTDGRVLTYEEVTEFWPHFNRNYIPVYRPEQADAITQIIGGDLDDGVMWQNALVRVQGDTAVQPDNPFNWFNLGTIYNALGDYEKAATAFDQARAIGLPWRMLWYQFGPYEAYYQMGRYDDVILLADVTLKDRPYFEESFYYKGLALAAMGAVSEARDNLQKAADFNPNYRPAAAALADLGS